jgi:heme exporter protein C
MVVRLSTFFPALVLLSMLAALYAVFVYVPTEREMGLVQRIFYFHVPSAVSAFLAFFLVFVSSIQYLRTQEVRWDRLAACAAELGVLFSLIVLVTGPIWARPIWGAYWRWEPRLTSMLILFCLYVTYLMVRSYGTDPSRTPRLAAVLGILTFVNVPLVYFSVHLWAAEQQLHPRQVALDPPMKYTLLICFGAFLLFFFYLLKSRLELEKSADILLRLKQKMVEGE